MAELAGLCSVLKTLIHAYRKQLTPNAELVFAPNTRLANPNVTNQQCEVYEQIGRSQMELS